jgi:glycosyltransferase involved in cell wall biosynthesis
MALALGMGDCVRFLGNVDTKDLVRLYGTCDLVVLPSISRREAFGLVQLEASAAGKPVVASDIPGVSEVTRKVGGYLAKPADADSLAAQIARALGVSNDPERLKEAAATMSWENVTAEYEELFRTLLRAHEPVTPEPLTSSEPKASLPELSAAPASPRRLEKFEDGQK